MDFLGLGLSFVAIIYLVSRKINVGIAMFIGAVILALFLKFSLSEFVSNLFNSLTNPLTLQLMLTILFISGLGFVLKDSGVLEKFISSLTQVIKSERNSFMTFCASRKEWL